jgi:hypothetical protein
MADRCGCHGRPPVAHTVSGGPRRQFVAGVGALAGTGAVAWVVLSQCLPRDNPGGLLRWGANDS